MIFSKRFLLYFRNLLLIISPFLDYIRIYSVPKTGSKLTAKWLKIHTDARLREYVHKGDAGFDIAVVEEVMLMAFEKKAVRTGLKVEIPYGYELQIRPRSGISIRMRQLPIKLWGVFKVLCQVISTGKYYHSFNAPSSLPSIYLPQLLFPTNQIHLENFCNFYQTMQLIYYHNSHLYQNVFQTL